MFVTRTVVLVSEGGTVWVPGEESGVERQGRRRKLCRRTGKKELRENDESKVSVTRERKKRSEEPQRKSQRERSRRRRRVEIRTS